MSDISLRPLAEVILDQVTAGRREAYERLRTKAFEAKRRFSAIVDTRLGPVRDPNLSNETTDSLRATFRQINDEMYHLSDECATYKRNNPSGVEVPSVDDVLAELEQCQREMAEIRWNLEEKWISAITNRIVLAVPDTEDNHTIDLGPFEIRLFYEPTRGSTSRRRPGRTYRYDVIALEPYYPLAQRREGHRGQHPHPHINGSTLCEGEATTALTRALIEFRLCDFFILINATLNHYNPRSPHYRLQEWDRVRCRDCSNYVTEEDLAPCSYCETKMCRSCAAVKTCAICHKTICSRHSGQRRIRKCDKCDQYVCMQHYKSIRKHTCFKEIKKERKEAAKKRLELIEQINTRRTKIAKKKSKKAKKNGAVPPEEPQQDEGSVEEVEVQGPLRAIRRRADNRTNEDIARDIELGEQENTGPTGWAN